MEGECEFAQPEPDKLGSAVGRGVLLLVYGTTDEARLNWNVAVEVAVGESACLLPQDEGKVSCREGMNMGQRVSITLSIPIRIKRIANGEKIFVPGDGRDDVEVKMIEDDTAGGKSPLATFHELLDAYEKEAQKTRRKTRRGQKVLTPGVLSIDGS